MGRLVILALLAEVLLAQEVVCRLANEAMMGWAFVVSASSLNVDTATAMAR